MAGQDIRFRAFQIAHEGIAEKFDVEYSILAENQFLYSIIMESGISLKTFLMLFIM
jgi:hypothetical protein